MSYNEGSQDQGEQWQSHSLEMQDMCTHNKNTLKMNSKTVELVLIDTKWTTPTPPLPQIHMHSRW